MAPMLVAIWILTLFGLMLWSLLAWGLHMVLAIDPLWIEDANVLIAQIPFAELIDRWIPGWHEMMHAAMDLTQVTLSWVGTNAPLVAWIVWSIGALVLVGTGMALALVVCLLTDKPTQPLQPTPQ